MALSGFRRWGFRPAGWFLFVWFLSATGGYAQSLGLAAMPRVLNLNPKVIDDGLSHSTVYAMVQDRQGFIWFATQEGLNKYDGYSFKVFRQKRGSSHGLPEDNLGCMILDRDGFIWIGSWGGGLIRLDPANERFEVLANVEENADSLSHDRVQALVQGPDGTIWVGTAGGGLNRVDPKTLAVQRFPVGDPPNGLPHDRIWSITTDPEGNVWIGTGGGLVLFHKDTQAFELFENERFGQPGNQIRALHFDHTGALWLGSRAGLSRFDRVNHRFDDYFPFPEATAQPTLNGVNTIFEDRQGVLWVGLMTGGLCLFDRELREFTFITQDRSFYGDIRCIMEDAANNLWVGTRGAGTRIFNPRASFEHVSHNPLTRNSLSSSQIWSFCADGFGHLWVGTMYGLNRIEQKSQSITRYFHDPNDANTLSHNSVEALLEDREGDLWVGTRGGLDRFRNNRFERIEHTQEGRARWVQALLEDQARQIWVGTMDGLFHYDRSSRRFDVFRNEPDQPNSLGHQAVLSLANDQVGRLWVGTGNGLDLYLPNSGSFRHYRHNPNDQDSLSNNRIWWIHCGDKVQQHELWLATDHGLNRFLPETGSFESWHEEDGLPSNRVSGILSDSHGFLWISTHLGLARFDPRSNVFRRYGVENGLQSDYFFPGACFRDLDGTLYFGGLNGFNSFQPKRLLPNDTNPELLLTKVVVEDHDLPISRFNAGQSIDLSPASQIALSFALLDPAGADSHVYRYRLEGLDKHWSPSIKGRRVSYQRLPPGSYTFTVEGVNAEGKRKRASLPIEVHEEPAQTATSLWWLLAPVGLLLIFAVTRRRQQPRHVAVAPVQTGLKNTPLGDLARELGMLVEKPVVFFDEVDRITWINEHASRLVGEQLVSSSISDLPANYPVLQRFPAKEGGGFLVLGSKPIECINPLAEGALDDWLIPGSRPAINGYEGGRRKILVVDDQLKNRLALDSLLGGLNFDVISAENGANGVDLAVRERPDLILMDVAMPAMNGFQAIDRIRGNLKQPPVCIAALSGESKDKPSDDDLALCDGFLSKPVRIDVLLDLMARHLDLVWHR